MRLNQYARQLDDVARVHPVLTPVRDSLTTEQYLAITESELEAYLRAQYGDDDEN